MFCRFSALDYELITVTSLKPVERVIKYGAILVHFKFPFIRMPWTDTTDK